MIKEQLEVKGKINVSKITENLKTYSSNIFKSITTDNGSDFSRYEEIEKKYSGQKYIFAIQ